MSMRQERIKITVMTTGETKLEALCVPGQDCLAATAPLEEALGGEVKDRKYKPEFYQAKESDKAAAYTGSGNS